jgi:hypothetical protein
MAVTLPGALPRLLPGALPARGMIVLGTDVGSVRGRPPLAVSFADVDIRQL